MASYRLCLCHINTSKTPDSSHFPKVNTDYFWGPAPLQRDLPSCGPAYGSMGAQAYPPHRKLGEPSVGEGISCFPSSEAFSSHHLPPPRKAGQGLLLSISSLKLGRDPVELTDILRPTRHMGLRPQYKPGSQDSEAEGSTESRLQAWKQGLP